MVFRKFNSNRNEKKKKKEMNKPVYLGFYNPRQNIWHKVEKCSKVGQDFKSLLSNFTCFLRAIVKL